MAMILGATLLIASSCGGGGGPDASPAPRGSRAIISPTPQFPPPASPLQGSKVVKFRTSDGVQLGGRLFGSGRIGIVLSQGGPDQTDWYDDAGLLAEHGYLVLTYNFRGICPGGEAGCSRGTFHPGTPTTDAAAAASFLRSQGASKVILMGLFFGAMANMEVVSERGEQVSAHVVIDAREFAFGFDFSRDDVRKLKGPKLFVGTQLIGESETSANDFFSWATPPKDIEMLNTGEQGSDILRSDQADRLRGIVLNWLDRYFPAS